MRESAGAFVALSFLSFVVRAGTPVWMDGEDGLWRLSFADGTVLSAADLATNGIAGTANVSREKDVTVRSWTSDAADVRVTERRDRKGAVDLSATVTPHGGRVLRRVWLPARLRFAADAVDRFVYPGNGNGGVGLGFNERFFDRSTVERPKFWRPAGPSGGDGYAYLYGGGLRCLPLDLPKTNLVVTAAGREWLGEEAVKAFAGWRRTVLRPPAEGQSDLVLIDSPNGPFFSARRFGGTGALWRFAGAGSGGFERIAPCEDYVLERLLPRLARTHPQRRRVVLVALRQGPKSGAFVHLGVRDWRAMLKGALPPGCTYEEATDLAELRAVFSAKDVLVAVNPYGEQFPVGRAGELMARLDELKGFVRAGGNWIEAGGYPFYRQLVCEGYLSIGEAYPPLFADFAHLKTKDGRTAAVYGLQPRAPHEPWSCPRRFVPGETKLGGDERGGWYEHAFACWVTNDATFSTPAVRLNEGLSVEAALADYAEMNGLVRALSEKVRDPDRLKRFRHAPLFFLVGSARRKVAALERIPSPTLLHYCDYLKGGFDKEYPDHLPPNPQFGTPEELRRFHDLAHARGHLVSPYTNPTWWCDHPRGPSFVRAGDAPLAVGTDGKPLYERYERNDGWSVTFWHPAVQRANRETVRAFTADYPVDLLFQDQCGARAGRLDFNCAAPDPMSYTEGILSMNEEDSRIVPIGTEDGWDRVANEQTALCGCTWRTVPAKRPVWRELYKDAYPADCWSMEPVTTRLFHGRLFFYMHDLGSFVMDERTLVWMLALGYQLSYWATVDGYLGSAEQREWYDWLHLIQDKVVSRLAGRPLVAFRHDRTPLLALPGDPSREEDDGLVVAQYGDVKVSANLGDVPRTVEGRKLAAYGWWIEAPGLKSAKLDGCEAFVECDGCRLTRTSLRTLETGK